MTMVKLPIQKQPAKEPVEEEDKDAKEKEKAMAACEKIAKVDCKYFKPNKHKARAENKQKRILHGVYCTSHFFAVRFKFCVFWLMVWNSFSESLNYALLNHNKVFIW